MLKKLIGLLAVAGALVSGPAAKANVIGLVIDGSGSISSSDFDLQTNGYVNALTSLLPANGLNAIGVWQFSGAGQLQLVHAVTLINSAAAKTSLLNDISNMVQIGSTTAIGDAIAAAADAILAFNGAGDWIIDVSTDGQNNDGTRTAAQGSAYALGKGVDRVNCLGVGGAADCNFIAGTGAFSMAANNFSEFETAITNKLSQEVSVPEPATLVVLGLGLAGLGFVRRRKTA